MTEKNAQAAADRFMTKLTGKGFSVSRSQNKAENYDIAKQERDSEAVAEFAQTKVFKYIMSLR